jgi:membrane-bound lytic murein transglycosylase D
MPFGNQSSWPTLARHGKSALAAAIFLGLAAQSHAGWFGRKSAEPRPEEVAVVEHSPVAISALAATDSSSGATIEARSEALPETPGNSELDQGLATDNTLDDPATTEDAAQEEDDKDESVVLLPNVEESEVNGLDTADLNYSAEELAARGDLWERLRKGFQMETSVDNERIEIQRNWYLRNSDYLNRMALRASRYLHYTVGEAEKRNLPTELALLPVIESAYDPFAYSHAHAAGMWQFIPGTARIMGVKQNEWFDGRRDILESTRAAYDFLTMLYQKFGDWQLALAAYNAGPGAVQRAINRNQEAGLPTDFWSLKLPAETRSYVPRFLAMAQIVKSPESFGVSLRPVLNQPFFRVINTKGQVDLPQAAQIAGISLRELFQLNPGFKRQATDPEGPHRLLVPAALPQDFESDIAALHPPALVATETYKVRKGDTLYRVARKHNVNPADLKRLNGLKSDRLPVGRVLTIARGNASPEFLALRSELKLDRTYSPVKVVRSKVYKVRRGDTLMSIARRHGISAKALARMNGMSTKTKVRAGQFLTVRQVKASGKQRVASTAKGKKAGVRKIRYEVRRGDTLASIGKRYKVSIKQIKRWNASSSKLRPGQDLVLFVGGPSSRSL